MKVIVVSESPTDEAAIRVFIEATLHNVISFQSAPMRLDGFTAVEKNLGAILKAAFYHTDADGVAVVVDSDNSPIQSRTANNRLDLLRQRTAEIMSRLGNRPVGNILRTAIGLAVPSLEAWLLYGTNPDCTEAGWLVKQRQLRFSRDAIKALKLQLFGSDRKPQAAQQMIAETAARRLVDEGRFPELRRSFPFGLGTFLNELEQWSATRRRVQ